MNNRSRHSRGFSLIEVMMAVLILGIGMLGLGAILPVVVRQQQSSADVTFGTLAAQNAELYLRSNNKLSNAFWQRWASYRPDPRVVTNPNQPQLPGDIPNDGGWLIPAIDESLGGMVVLERAYAGYTLPNGGGTVDPVDRRVRISLADRLFPSDAADGSEPQFVWDMAVRRVQARGPISVIGSPAPAPLVLPWGDSLIGDQPDSTTLQVAIFVRRIDGRIRLGNNESLPEVLTKWSAPANQRRWPASVLAQTGEPTYDGRVDTSGTGTRYSTPISQNVTVAALTGTPEVATRLDLLQVGASIPSLTALSSLCNGTNPITMTPALATNYMGAPGQQIVDNNGNIHEVVGTETVAGVTYVKLAKAIRIEDAQRLVQAIFTPQVPATVVLFKVTR